MSSYDLLEHFEDVNDPSQYRLHKPFNQGSDEGINKSLFKDKKLNKLWNKAEHGGFTGKPSKLLYVYCNICATWSPLLILWIK